MASVLIRLGYDNTLVMRYAQVHIVGFNSLTTYKDIISDNVVSMGEYEVTLFDYDQDTQIGKSQERYFQEIVLPLMKRHGTDTSQTLRLMSATRVFVAREFNIPYTNINIAVVDKRF